MTSSLRHEVARRSGPGRRVARSARSTFAGELARALAKELEAVLSITFPSDRYQSDPVAFCRDILGVLLWDRQIEILHAVRDYDRVAVKSGRRIGKSLLVAAIALWWYCSWKDARVVMSSTTARQVDQILWRELSMLRARAGRCVSCKAKDPNGHRIPAPCPHSARIDGDIGMLARTGLKSDDFREIVGFTARQAEAVQGIAGSRLLFLIDEASGVPQEIFDAIEGNRAGGGKALLFGNPTKNRGEFFDAFHKKALNPKDKDPRPTGYLGITISSEESPNVSAGRDVIPGLATRDYIRERELEWGRESPLFRIHVLGEFATNEEGRIFSVATITEAEARWKAGACERCDAGYVDGRPCSACKGTGRQPAAGRLFIGLDPAGPAGTGDESVFAPRRGEVLLDLVALRGLNEDGLLAQTLAIIERFKLRAGRETPVVVIDREGSVGAGLYGRMRAFLEEKRARAPFELVAVRASDRAMRQPDVYDRQRDALVGNLESWIREGGAVPEDTKLAAEMNALEWRQQINGRFKVTPKDEIKKMLGRSPDRLDALALSVWEPLSLMDDAPESVKRAQEAAAESFQGADPFAPDALVDPYGDRDLR